MWYLIVAKVKDRPKNQKGNKMARYALIIGRAGSSVTFPVAGCDAAYAAFRMACELAELTGGCVSLIDAETAEVLADNSDCGEADF